MRSSSIVPSYHKNIFVRCSFFSNKVRIAGSVSRFAHAAVGVYYERGKASGNPEWWQTKATPLYYPASLKVDERGVVGLGGIPRHQADLGGMLLGFFRVSAGGRDDHAGRRELRSQCAPGFSFLRVTIKQSKTDPFRKGVDIFVGRTGTDICPVAAILSYLECRGSGPGPLFVFSSGRFLTRKRFVELVRAALSSAGVDQEKYCGHSFRIGAATTAAAKGVEDSIIKTLGRWESVAYLQYVRIPRNQLTSYSSLLGAPA